MDGRGPFRDWSAREGEQERCTVRAPDRPDDHPAVHRGIHGDRSLLQEGGGTSSTSVRRDCGSLKRSLFTHKG
tara:strand:- start:2069 stop:2287 length:219 start_codon:yes stop_codon:yes gene_type:complete